MVVAKDEKENGPLKLATEGPLTEKDEQGQTIERAKKLAQEALGRWHRLKEKIIKPFKK